MWGLETPPGVPLAPESILVSRLLSFLERAGFRGTHLVPLKQSSMLTAELGAWKQTPASSAYRVFDTPVMMTFFSAPLESFMKLRFSLSQPNDSGALILE